MVKEKQVEKKVAAPSAVDTFVAQGMTFEALENTLKYIDELGGTKAEDELKTLLKKLCLSAQGSRYALRLSEAQLPKLTQMLLLVCETDYKAADLIQALCADAVGFRKQNHAAIESFVKTAEKVVPKLVTHIQKTRNPDSQISLFKSAPLTSKTYAVGSSSGVRRISATDAQLVGQRWFWEVSVVVNKTHRQLIDAINSSLKSANNGNWPWSTPEARELPSPKDEFPKTVGALSHQIFFHAPAGKYICLTPLTSVGGLSELVSSEAAALAWRRTRSAEYGGANARNIAAFMMDRSGQIRHPNNSPWIAPKSTPISLLGFLKYPDRLVSKAWLTTLTEEALLLPHIDAANNQSRHVRLSKLLEPVLKTSCDKLLELRDSYRNGELPEAINSEHILLGWALADKPLSPTKAKRVSDMILLKAIGYLRTKNFDRWQELELVASEWLNNV